MMVDFCFAVQAYLAEDPENVAAIHCKAGKGRTGLMMSCLLLHLGIVSTVEGALEHFGRARTENGKGVTIPSQARYVGYFASLRLSPTDVSQLTWNPARLTVVRMHGAPSFDTGGGCDPYIVVSKVNEETLFRSRPVPYRRWKSAGFLDLEVENLPLQGDVRVTLFDHDSTSADDEMCSAAFNTHFIEDDRLVLRRLEIDGCHKDKAKGKFPLSFSLELCFNGRRPDPIDPDAEERERERVGALAASVSARLSVRGEEARAAASVDAVAKELYVNQLRASSGGRAEVTEGEGGVEGGDEEKE
jgi:phosphatidylinositol-3,4,5-trisphosphate 3-phosphatase/dual-specificity protein phosphatase PTEN